MSKSKDDDAIAKRNALAERETALGLGDIERARAADAFARGYIDATEYERRRARRRPTDTRDLMALYREDEAAVAEKPGFTRRRAAGDSGDNGDFGAPAISRRTHKHDDDLEAALAPPTARGGKKSRRKRTKRRRTIGGKKSRKLRKRTTLKGGKRKRRRTRRRR